MASNSGTRVLSVSSSRELATAYNTLSKSDGGTIQVSRGSAPIEIALKDGGSSHVKIVSSDQSNPTQIHRIAVYDAENITVSGFEVDSSDVSRPGWHNDVMVSNSDNVIIEDSTFSSNAVGRYDPKDDTTFLGESLGLARGSTNFVFRNNTVENYYQGLAVRESVDVDIESNEFEGMQGDGIRLQGVQNVIIADNYMHNFIGTSNNFNHNDFIQVWSTNSTNITKNLKIEGNILDSAEGSSAQGIFIGNEKFSSGDKSHRYQNIDISDNLVYTGNANGIAVFGAEKVKVTDNTLLWNQNAEIIADLGADGVSRAPMIRVAKALDTQVSDNIAPGLNLDGNVRTDGNRLIDYTSINNPNNIDTHFVSASKGGGQELNDFRLRSDSSWNGEAGSSLTEALTRSAEGVTPIFIARPEGGDPREITFDATYSVDEDGAIGKDYKVVWTLDDGTVLTGAKVDHVFARAGTTDVHMDIYEGGTRVAGSEREIDVLSRDFVKLSLDGNVKDSSAYDASVTLDGARALAGGGYRIDGSDSIVITRENSQIHDLESFAITMDMTVLDSDSGRFLMLYPVMEARVLDSGAVQFRLETDEGRFTVRSSGSIDDGDEHRLGFAYDGESLALYIDGKIVDETEASGTTASGAYQDLVIGSLWSGAMRSEITEFHFGSDAQTVGLKAPNPAQPEKPVVEAPVVEAPEAPVEEGPESAPEPATPDVPANFDPLAPTGLRTVVDVDFSDPDAASQSAGLQGFKVANLTSGSAPAYQVEGGQTLQIARETSGLHEMDAFVFDVDFAKDAGDDSGSLAHFHKVLNLWLDDGEELVVDFTTDEGRFEIRADGAFLSDGEVHNIGVAYDDEAGLLNLFADDLVLGQVEASGTTADRSYYGLTVGHTWNSRYHDTLDGELHALHLESRVDGAGPEADPAPAAPQVPVVDVVEEVDNFYAPSNAGIVEVLVG